MQVDATRPQAVEQDSAALPTHRRLALGAHWTTALLLIFAVLMARLAYLIWFCPYQLVGDEGYYWQQARHLDWGYDEKGPALAWMIAGSCALFGDTEWAVRLPVVVAFVLSAWGVGRLAIAVSRGLRRAQSSRDERVGFFAVAIFCLLPAFQANAQICTQDGLLIALWVAMTAIGLLLLRRWHAGKNTWFEWLLLWFVPGIGVLVKHTVVLLLPGLALYAWIQRRRLPWRWGELISQQLVGLLVLLVAASPMLVWNAQHGWPMLAHTLGHLGAGGDQGGHVNKGNPALWVLITIGGIVGAFGPAAIFLMLWAGRDAFRARSDDPQRWRDRLWLMCAAWPHALFFVLLSLTKPVVPSWPLPSLVPLVVLVADLAVPELARWSALRQSWLSGRKRGGQPRERKPETLFHQAWVVLVVYGLVGWVVLSFPTALAYLPWAGPRIQRSLVKRIAGHREAAADLAAVLASVTPPGGEAPPVVTRHYMAAALHSFYLPDHPVVRTAGKYLGKRSTTFDEWPDTRLDNPALYGKTLLLEGQGDVPWERGLIFDSLEPVADGRYFLAHNYRGPRPDHPMLVKGED
jgi:hypothetical protein